MYQKINIQAVKLKAVVTMLLIFFAGQAIYSQPAMKMQDGRFCEGDEILLPVNVDNFDQISSFTLYLGFNPQILTFIDVSNLHEQFNTGTLMATFHDNNGDPLLIVTWIESNNNPATVPDNDGLFDLRFEYTSGESPVFFKSGCEISIGMSPVAEAVFSDGSIGPFEITAQPQEQFVAQNQQATFIIGTNGAAQYKWMVKNGGNWNYIVDDDHHLGSGTSQLIINNTPREFDSRFYRCEITAGNCSLFTEEALLNVSALSTGEMNSNTGFMVYPNPFTNDLHVRINNHASQQIAWTLFTGNGKMIAGERVDAITDQVNISGISGLSAGVYFLQLHDDKLLLGTTKILKH